MERRAGDRPMKKAKELSQFTVAQTDRPNGELDRPALGSQ